MVTLKRVSGVLVVLALGVAVAHAGTASQADTLFVNGRIDTPAGWVQAMAVAKGDILAVGTNAQIKKMSGPSTQTVDLRGKSVFPGFFDMHVHPMMASNGAEGACRIEQGATAAQLLKVVSECVAAMPHGDWVTGAQWQASSMGTTPITRQTLDAVSPHNPVMLFDISGHSLWVNSRALEAAGIRHDTPNPTGGIIERDSAGEPTGILRETARDMILQKVPKSTPSMNLAALKKSLQLLLSKGVTGLTDAMVFREDLVAYDTLADRGALHQTVRTCIAYSHAGKVVPGNEQLIAERQHYARATLRPDCVKVFMDGVPTESHTGAMLEPYVDDQPNAPPRGMLLVEPAVLNPALAAWDAQGLTVLFHAAGDAAVRAALDAVAFARKTNGLKGPRHQIGHTSFAAVADLKRAQLLNATIEFSPYLWYPQPIDDDITKAVGTMRTRRAWPIREGLQTGALVVAGSDWAVVPDPDPWLAIETSITRRAPGGEGEQFGGQEAITLRQALDIFTINGARQMGVQDRQGSLEAGKQADFIIVSADPFGMPATKIHTIRVEQTYTRGRRVFDRSAQVQYPDGADSR